MSLIPGEDSEAGSSSISILSRRAVVKQERLQDVVNGYHYQVDNYWDQWYTPRLVSKIISSVKEKIGQVVEYSVLDWKHKNFVTHLRYGMANMAQVSSSWG